MYQNNWGPFWLIGAIIMIIPLWRICQRLGWSPWWSLLWAVPIVDIIFIYVLAFSNRPLQGPSTAPGSR